MTKRNRSGKRKMTQREGGANGRPKRDRKPDRGTPELQSKRQALVGQGDTALSTRWLDILTARRLIDANQQQAGADFARAYWRVYGKPHPASSDARIPAERRNSPADGDERDLTEDDTRKLKAASAALKSISRAVYDAVRDLAVYDRKPALMLYAESEQFPTTSALKQWARIETGLEALVGLEADNRERRAA